jgi:hypothetical protein
MATRIFGWIFFIGCTACVVGAVLENNKRLDGSLTRLLSDGGFFAGLAVLGLIMALKPIKPKKPPDEASVENTISN